jgi:polyhydroxyalkanoate synthesis regulator phasin
MSAMNRNIDRFIGDTGEAANTAAAQQRAIDELARRVAALERPQQ